MQNLFKYIVLFCLPVVMAACDKASEPVAEYVPEAPDYSDAQFWFTRQNANADSGADVFYIVSTWEADWHTTDSAICHYADVYSQTHRDRMAIEIGKVAEYMGTGNNFYSPYYRHMTIDIWQTQNEDTIDSRFEMPFEDIKAAFDYYMQNYNNGRPIVLAGFSQGGKSVVELLKVMDEATREKLVAAYVLGYKVTPSDTISRPWIRGAQSATDTGVTICYNSVSSIENIKPVIAAPCAMCINPVNWKTDATPATLHDTITVVCNPEHHVLVLEGYSGSEYKPIRGFLNVGDFHSAEPWLYSRCLGNNIAQRIITYRALNGK